jgi:hypothetical protein
LNPEQIKHYGKWKFPHGLPKKDLLFNYHRVRSHLHKGLVVVEGPWGLRSRIHKRAKIASNAQIRNAPIAREPMRQRPVVRWAPKSCSGNRPRK